jgi:hypothetical protein
MIHQFLQENNAIAEIDLVRETITNVRGLGFKDWKKYKIDPSDSDGGRCTCAGVGEVCVCVS